MSVTWTLTKCSVISIQDSCVVYPSCQNCVSKLHISKSDLRYRCPKCGLTYKEQDVSYRYRLSLNVARDCDIFGVTVFGSCLNTHFGMSAVHLQRFVDESKNGAGDQQSRYVHRLLMKAVEDCFVGRCFLFRIKLPRNHTDGSMDPVSRDKNKISGQFIACQIFLPDSIGPGRPVLSYFEKRLQAAQKSGQWLGLHVQEDDSVLDSFVCTLDSFGTSLLEDNSGTRPFQAHWHKSPGIITSSAEQEEHSCFNPNGDAAIGFENYSKGQGSCKINQTFCHGTSFHDLSTHSYSSNMQGGCSYDVIPQDRCLGCSGCHGSEDGQPAEKLPSNGFPNSLFSLDNSLESSSAVTTPLVHNVLNFSELSRVLDVKQKRSECFGLNLKLRSVLSTGNDVSSFPERLSISEVHRSLPYTNVSENLPCSERLGQFLCKEERVSEILAKNNVYNFVGKHEKLRDNGCICEMHHNAHTHQKKVCCTSVSCNSIELLRNSSFKSNGGSCRHLSLCSISSPLDNYCSNVGTHSIEPNQIENIRESSLARSNSEFTFSHLPCASKALEKADKSLLLSKALTMQESLALKHLKDCGYCDVYVSECKDYLEDESKKPSNASGMMKCLSNCCSTELKKDESGPAISNWEGENKEGESQSSFCSAEGVYNASADLFNYSQGGTNEGQGADNEVSQVLLRSGNGTSDCFKDCPLVGLDFTGSLRSNKRKRNHSCALPVLDLELADSLDFIPFSQSTPISKNLKVLQVIPSKDDRQAHNAVQGNNVLAEEHLKWHHNDYNMQSNGKNLCLSLCGSDSEEEILPSIEKILPSSEWNKLTGSVKRCEHADVCPCRRVLLASREKGTCRKNVCAKTDNDGNGRRATEGVGQELNHVTTFFSNPNQWDCREYLNFGNLTTVVNRQTSTNNSSVCNSVMSMPSAECNRSTCDWSADLFAD